jgi:hypothetical protein
LAQDTESQKIPAAVPAMVQIPVRGGAIIEFTDAAAAPKLMQWTMTFDPKGRLLKATHMPIGLLTITGLPPTLGDVRAAPLPSTVKDIDLAGNAVQ